jgi:pimeloyl-ACP methyl ester carboxylesterase
MTSSRTPISAGAVGPLLAIATLLGGMAFARAEPKYRFEKSACPEMPAPIPELKTARCGQLTVPENRSKPTGRTIALWVAVIPAASADPKPDPIVWLAGGPGDDAITEIPMALAGKLNRDRDVVFMSQRGTYSAKPSLTCPEVDRVLGDTLAMAYGVPAMQETYTKATAECRQRLEGLGADLAAYNTIESSADLEDLRAALSIAQWNVFGISYGTLYALTYMRLYPEGIRSVGIDGVFPPEIAGGVSDWQSAGEGINAIFAACNIAPRCRERYGDIGATFRELVQKYEQSPETVKVSVPGFSEPVKVTISG